MRVRADERAPSKPSARFPKYVSAALKRIAVNLNLSLCVMVLVALRPLSVMAGLVPAIYFFLSVCAARRGWPGQVFSPGR